MFIKKYGPAIFLVLLLAHCYCIGVGAGQWRTITKLSLLPFLLLYLFAARETAVSRLAVAALVFSFLGDLLLTQPGEMLFLAGMLAFMGTHVCNAFFFLTLKKGASTETKGITAIVMVFIGMFMVLLGAFVFCRLQAHLGKFLLPVAVYMVVISVMAVCSGAVLRNSFLSKAAVRYMIPGAVLFALSDAILALNKFLWHEQMADIAVMATYGPAQYLLVSGYIAATKKAAEKS